MFMHLRMKIHKSKILSPEQDLVVLPKSKIKIIYEASDDFGVKSVDLVCKKI